MLQNIYFLAWVVFFAFSPVLAVEQTAPTKALKYHSVLLKRAEPGYLYDRFYNTWLDESTVDQLQNFLTSRVEKNPDTADRLLLAFFYVKQGDDIAAIEEFHQALATDPASAATWFHKALVESRTLDFDTAIADLLKAQKQNPNDKLAVRISKQLGKLLVRNQKQEAALKVWQELLEAHPGDQELQEDMIELHIDESLFSQAATLTQTLIQQTKDPYLAVTRRLRLGDIQYRGGDRAGALDIYTSALEQVGYNTWLEREVLAQIEHIFRREDDLTGLKKQYAKLREKHDKRISIHQRYAQLLAELGETDEAMVVYQNILKLTPGDRTNRETFVTMLSKMDRHAEAVKELETLCELHPKDGELRFWLANLRHLAGQADQVVSEVQRYLELSDRSEYAYLRTARLLERLEFTNEAGRIYEKMVDIHTESTAAQQAYATFLYSQDKKNDAINIWQNLAKDADLSQTLHIARSLQARHEHQTIFDLLSARQQQFDEQQLFYGQLITTAIALNKFEEAIPWTIRRVELAQSVTELETAIGQAATVLKRAGKLEEMARKLETQTVRSISLSCLLAELWEQLGNSEQADVVLKNLSQQNEQLFAISQQIRLYTARRDWQQAARATNKIIDLPGGQKSLYVRRLVELYIRDYQLSEALKWIDSWRQLSPGSPSPWLTEARILRLQGKQQDAVKVLRKASQHFEDEDLRAKLANAYSDLGKLGDAERIYWQLYEQTEDQSSKLQWVQHLATLSLQQGKTSQLVEKFEDRHRSNRRSIVPLLALAEIHRVADNYEGRRQALTSASKIKPDDLQLLLHIARVEESEGNWEAALKTLERASPLDKTNKTRKRMAGLHFQYGEADDGFAILNHLLEDEQTDPRSIESFADALCAMQDWQRAVDFLQQHLADFPDDYRLQYLLGVAMEEADQANEATEIFLSLLQDQKELPSTVSKNLSPRQSLRSQYDMLKQIAPPEVIDWMRLMQSKYTVYSFRQQQQRAYAYPSPMANRGSRSMINMPGQVGDVRSYAIAHLVSLQEMISDVEKAELVKRMTNFGIQDAEVILSLGFDHNSFTQSVMQLLSDQPQHETALAAMVLQQMGRRQIDTADHCARAFKVFRQSYPQLALLASAQAAAQESQYLPLLEQGLQFAQEIKQPSPMLMMSLVNQLGGLPGRQQQANELSDKYQKRLTELIISWYPQMLQSPQYSTWAFMYVTLALRNSGDPSTYLAFLEDEVARWNAGIQSANPKQMAAMFGRSRNQKLLQPLTFPPHQLVNFPAHVLSLLGKVDNSGPYAHLARQQSSTAWQMNALKPLVKDIKDPILRILVASQIANDDLVEQNSYDELIEKTLAEMIASEAPSADALFMAAAWAAQHGNLQRATALLETLRYMPLKRNLRQQIDSALVTMAVKPLEENSPSDSIKELGRKAALRLRRGKLDSNQRSELISALEELGLEKEAEKLERVAITTPATSRRASYPSVRVPNTSSQKDRISSLIAKGKRPMAVKLLAKEVLAQVQQFTMNLQNFGQRQHQFRSLRQRINTLAMAKEILAELDPGESVNPRRISDYASVCHLLEKTEIARAQYEKLLKIKPRDDNSRIRLIILLLDTTPGEVEVHLSKLSDYSSQIMGQVLTNHLNDYETSIADRLALVRIGDHYLQVLKDHKNPQLSWASQLIHTIGRGMHSRDGTNLFSLYATKNSTRKVSGKLVKLQKERATIHRDFCLSMLESPQTARTGFKHLLAADEVKEKVGPEHVEIAQSILLNEATQRSNHSYGQIRHSYSSSQQEVRFRSPEEFLVRRAWETNDWSEIDENLLPKLEQARFKQPYDALQREVALYRCAEDTFIKQATAILHRKSHSTLPGLSNNMPISAVVDAWAERQLKVDIRPLVLAQLKREISRQNHHRAPSYVLRYCVRLNEQVSTHDLAAFLEQVANLYLGPAKDRVKFVEKHFRQNQVQWGAPNGHIHVFRQLMQQLLQRDELMFVTLRHLQQYGSSVLLQNTANSCRSTLQRFKRQGSEALFKQLEKSSWLGNLENFQPLTVTDSAQDSLLVTLISDLSGDKAYRQSFMLLLKEQQQESPTFGQELLLVSLQQIEEPKNLLEFLGRQHEAIGKLSESRQGSLAAMLKQLITIDAHKSKELSDSAVSAQQWLEGKKVLQTRRQIEKLLATKRFEDLGIEAHQLQEYLSQRIPKYLADNPNTARDAFLKICDLVDDARRRGTWSMHYGSGTSIRGHLLGNIFNFGNRNQDLHVLPFLIDVLQNDKNIQIEVDYSVRNAIERSLRERLRQLNRKTTNSKTKKLDSIKQLFAELQEVLGDRPTSLLISGYRNILSSNLSKKERDQIATWLNQEATDNPNSTLISDWQATLAIGQSNRHRNRTGPGKHPTRIKRGSHHTYLENQLRHTELSLTWRMHLAKTIFDRERTRMPLATAAACLDVYNQSLSAAVPLLDDQQRSMLDLMISSVDESEMQELRKQWRHKWEARYLHPVRPNNSRNRTATLNSINNSSTLSCALKLYLLADNNSEVINKFFRYYEQHLGTNRLALALLVQSGNPERAAQLFRAHWLTMDVHRTDRSLVEFDQALSNNIPALLGLLPQESEKYTAELMLASLVDAKPLANGIETREQRMTRLAARYEQTNSSSAHRNRMLEILSTSVGAAQVVSVAIAEHYQTLDLLSAARNHDQRLLQQMLHVVAMHCRNRFREGDPKPWVESIQKFTGHWTGNQHQLQQAIQPLINCAVESIQEDGSCWHSEQSAAVAESLRSILSGRDNFHLNESEKYNQLLLTTHARAGTIDQLGSWHQSLSTNMQQMVGRQHQGVRVLKLAGAMFPDPNDDNLDQRIKMGLNMMQGAINLGWVRWNEHQPFRVYGQAGRTYAHHLVHYHLLEEQELLQHIEQITEKQQLHFLLLGDLASWLQDLKKYDPAAKLWHAAIAKTADGSPAQKVFSELQLVEVLYQAGKHGKASVLLASIDQNNVPSRYNRQYTKLKAKIQESTNQ